MPQPALELSDTALPLLEKLTEIRKQRRQHCEEGLVVFQLVGQLAAAPEALTRLEVVPQVCVPACQAIQLSELLRAKTAGETSARQTQSLTYRAHTHAGKPFYDILWPPQWRERHR